MWFRIARRPAALGVILGAMLLTASCGDSQSNSNAPNFNCNGNAVCVNNNSPDQSNTGSPGSSDPSDTSNEGGAVAQTSQQPDSSASAMAPSITEPSPTPAQLSLTELCNDPDAGIYAVCNPSTMNLGNQVFSYEIRDEPDSAPEWSTVLTYSGSACSKIFVQFAATSQETGSVDVRVLQSSGTPIATSASFGQIGTLTATLNGGPFSIEVNDTDGSVIYYNGYVVCLSS
jgi:hypothetical protein